MGLLKKKLNYEKIRADQQHIWNTAAKNKNKNKKMVWFNMGISPISNTLFKQYTMSNKGKKVINT